MKPAVLRALLVVVLLVVQLVTAAIVLLGMRHETVDLFAESAQSALSSLAGTVADQTQDFLAPAENALVVGRDLIAEGVLNATSDRDLERFFLAQMRFSPKLHGMHLGRSDGSFIGVARNDEGLLTRQVTVTGRHRAVLFTQRNEGLVITRSWAPATDDFDPRTRPWYQSARDEQSLVWTGVYSFFSTNVPGISAATPVLFADQRDAGVLSVDVDIVDLSAFLARLTGTSKSTAVILDETRHAVAFSELTLLTAQIRDGTMPTLDRVAGPALKSLFAQIERPGAEVTTLPTGFQRFKAADSTHVGYVRALQMSGGRVNWLLMVQAPADEFARGLGVLFTNKTRTLLAVIIVPAIIAVLAIFGLTEPVYRLHEDATVDKVTHALTRGEFERRLEGMLRSRREHERDKRVVVVAFDLDGFKQVNDLYGHSAGDSVLKEFISRLRSRLRQTDLVGRTGGDEFVVAMRLDPAVDVMTTIDTIRRESVLRLFHVPGGRHLLGVTAGVACAEQGESLDDLLSRADQALITGKAREKNRCYLAPDRAQDWPQTVIAARRLSSESSGKMDRGDTRVIGGLRAALPPTEVQERS